MSECHPIPTRSVFCFNFQSPYRSAYVRRSTLCSQGLTCACMYLEVAMRVRSIRIMAGNDSHAHSRLRMQVIAYRLVEQIPQTRETGTIILHLLVSITITVAFFWALDLSFALDDYRWGSRRYVIEWGCRVGRRVTLTVLGQRVWHRWHPVKMRGFRRHRKVSYQRRGAWSRTGGPSSRFR